MNNILIRKIIIITTLLVGNTVFMLLLGPLNIQDETYGRIFEIFGGVLGQLVLRLIAGILIIISYTIVLIIALKMFPKPKDTADKEDAGSDADSDVGSVTGKDTGYETDKESDSDQDPEKTPDNMGESKE